MYKDCNIPTDYHIDIYSLKVLETYNFDSFQSKTGCLMMIQELFLQYLHVKFLLGFPVLYQFMNSLSLLILLIFPSF